MKVIAITACPTGIAHTYMAADKLCKAAPKHDVQIKVETQGAMGIENQLTPKDIHWADMVLIASDIDIEQPARFTGLPITQIPIEKVLIDVDSVLKNYCQ